MTLSPVVLNHHVEEAIRLFKFSTMDAVSAGSADGLSRGELNGEMAQIEKEFRRRLPVGWSTSYQSLVKEFVTQQGYSSHALERTLFILEKKEVIRFSGQKKTVQRCVLSDVVGKPADESSSGWVFECTVYLLHMFLCCIHGANYPIPTRMVKIKCHGSLCRLVQR